MGYWHENFLNKYYQCYCIGWPSGESCIASPPLTLTFSKACPIHPWRELLITCLYIDSLPLTLTFSKACPCYTRAAVKSLFNRFKPAGERDKRSVDAIIFKRVHTALQCLLEVSPVGAREEALNLMAEAFPYFKLSPYRQVCFVSALLEMTSYIPDSRLRVLTIIVEKIIKLDAHLSREHVGKELKEGDKKPNDPMVETLDLLMKLMLTYINTNTHHEDK